MIRPRLVAAVATLAVAAVACSDESSSSPGGGALPDQEVVTPGPSGGPDVSGTGGAAGATTGAAGAPTGSGGADAGGEQYKYPEWMLLDVQPASAGYNTSYSLEAFRGRTIVVSLLEGYCTFCKSNARVLEGVVGDLKAEGYDVELVVLSDFAAEQFASIVSGPIFKDDGSGRPAWNTMRDGAVKHDTFIFAPNGERTDFIEGSYTGDAELLRSRVNDGVRAVAAK